MAQSALQFQYGITGRTLQFLVWDTAGSVWNGSSFVVYNLANLANYAQPMTQIGTSGRYQGTFPAVPGNAFYNAIIFDQAGVSLAETDPAVGGGDLWWDGAALTPAPPAAVGGTGTGARSVDVLVTDDNATALQGAIVRLTKGGETYVGNTAVNGLVVFDVDDGTWTVAITAVGYSFAPVQLVVAADVAVTYAMTPIAIVPSPPGLATGYFTCLDENGNIEAAVSVTCRAMEPADAVGAALDETPRTALSAANGLVQFVGLVKGATYRFQRGTSAKLYDFQIPADAGDVYALPSIIGSP